MRGCCWAAKRRDSAGLAEEALLALRAGKPVYLIGAFGGCAEAVIEALRKQARSAHAGLPIRHRVSGAAIELYNSQLAPSGDPIDFKALTAEFEGSALPD